MDLRSFLGKLKFKNAKDANTFMARHGYALETETHSINWEYRMIYRQFKGGVAPRKIAKEYGISRQRVHDIVKIYENTIREQDLAAEAAVTIGVK